MANTCLLLLVILSIVNTSLQDTNDNEVDVEDINPLAEAASAILKEQNAENIGAMVNNFMQSGGAAQLGGMLSKFGSENAGQLLQGLGSLMSSSKKEQDEDDTGGKLLEGLGSIVGALQGTGGGGEGGALLQGLGSLLGGQGEQGGQGGIDPAIIGSVISMFAQNQAQPSKPKKSKSPKKMVKVDSTKKDESNVDMGDLLSLAGSFFGQDEGKGQAGNLLSFLPMIMQTLGSFAGPEAEKRAESHSDHAWLLPPVLEKLHIMFDNFIHSDMGKYFINVIGAEKTFKVFADENGRFSYRKFVEMMENHSFRRHWIRLVTDRIADMLQYLTSAQYFINSFLKGQGFPKTTLFNPARPTESISALANYVAQKYFEVKIESKGYVKSAVKYVQDLIHLTQKNRNGGGSRELSDKLADTINLEIIEPMARVNRAYRFAKSVPVCDRYVLCLVNEENSNELESLPGLKNFCIKDQVC
ncbi:hypothetical protein NQ314_002440 [Rhamnusium bicolor]|uniref:Uncharacterized protein n=1 Tax=Rhamnusium bicolor TaxID=1586634 RepID=A0AAV8ZQ37_9CUCU|nr:hypothetical protein NQ314_002440 [Rhamnusium bicolor]